MRDVPRPKVPVIGSTNPTTNHHPTSSLVLIIHTSSMVHEVLSRDSDSDWVDDEEQDELEQDPLMVIQDRVRPAELKVMTVANVCRASYCSDF